MRTFRVAALALLVAAAAAYPLRADDKVVLKDCEWYPLAVGTTWTYKVGEQERKITVSAHEMVGDIPCARLDSSGADGKGTEDVTVKDDGVYRVSSNGVKLVPPLCLLKLPAKTGTRWKVKYKEGALSVKGTFTIDDEDDVEVPAGTYKTTVIARGDMIAGENALTIAYYFASGVGMVKQEVIHGGKVVSIDLAKFKKADDK
jgi:hypothetical protein